MVEKTLNEKRGWIDRLLQRIGQVLVDDERRGKLLRTIGKVTRILLWVCSIGYILGVLAIGWIGERHILFAYFLYVPPLAWLIPLFPLAFLALFADRRLLIVLGLWAAIYLWPILGYNFGSVDGSKGKTDSEFTVMTYNRGQRKGSLKPFKNAQSPDILVMQDARGAYAGYKADPDYGEFEYGTNVWEYTILSRYPIISEELVMGPFADSEFKMAARFVLDMGDQGQLVVYSVHLPTPRSVLNARLRGTVAASLLGFSGTGLGEKKAEMKSMWQGRRDLAAALVQQVEKETLPVVVAGDLNMPARGVIYRQMTSSLRDAHAETGAGYGYTFPGATKNPLSLFGPWLRLDYLLSNEKLQPIWCETEQDRPSQHRAVAARFRLEE